MFQLLDQTKSERYRSHSRLRPPSLTLSRSAATGNPPPREGSWRPLSPPHLTTQRYTMPSARSSAQQENYADAKTQFRRAISLDPTLASAHYHLGSVFLNQGDPAAAVTELSSGKQSRQRQASSMLCSLVVLFAQTIRTKPALTVLRHALAVDPASVDAKYELALTLQANDNAREALPLFEQVVRHGPRTLPRSQISASLSCRQATPKAQFLFYLRALALNAQKRDAARGSRRRLSPAERSQPRHRAVSRRPRCRTRQSPTPLRSRSRAQAERRSDRRLFWSSNAPKSSIRICPTHPTRSAFSTCSSGALPKLQVELEKATTLRPDNGDAWAILGNVYKETNEPQKAAAALRRAIELLPNQPSPHISLAAVLSPAGRYRRRSRRTQKGRRPQPHCRQPPARQLRPRSRQNTSEARSGR